MASIVVTGDTSGAITIAAPAVAGTNTLTLPASTGTLVVTGGAQTIEFADGSAAAPSITNSGDTNTGMFFPAADTIAFTEGGTEAMRLDSAGNVGIGTSSPANKLVVSGTGTVSSRTIATNTGGDASFFVQNDASGLAGPLVYGTTKAAYGALGSGEAAFYSNVACTLMSENTLKFAAGGNTERMRIDSSGNLLVGTTSSITGGRSAFWSSTAAAAAEFRVNAGSSDATQAVTIIKNSTTNSTAQVLMNFTVNNGNTGAGQINCNGASAAAFGTFSDVRLKENIVDLPPQLDNILSIRPVEFDYIESEGGGHQIGFIAQEFEEVYADSVGERADGMKTLTGWSKTEARLVKAIQELNAKVDAQAVRIAELEGAK